MEEETGYLDQLVGQFDEFLESFKKGENGVVNANQEMPDEPSIQVITTGVVNIQTSSVNNWITEDDLKSQFHYYSGKSRKSPRPKFYRNSVDQYTVSNSFDPAFMQSPDPLIHDDINNIENQLMGKDESNNEEGMFLFQIIEMMTGYCKKMFQADLARNNKNSLKIFKRMDRIIDSISWSSWSSIYPESALSRICNMFGAGKLPNNVSQESVAILCEKFESFMDDKTKKLMDDYYAEIMEEDLDGV